jgi:hypothetical protein
MIFEDTFGLAFLAASFF